MTYPSLIWEHELRDVLKVVQVDDVVERGPGLHEREPALLFWSDLLHDLGDSVRVDRPEAERIAGISYQMDGQWEQREHILL